METIKTTVLSDVLPCCLVRCLVDVYYHFGGIGKMEAACSIKTTVPFYQTMQNFISDVHVTDCWCEVRFIKQLS
jgi:hypothetical protein